MRKIILILSVCFLLFACENKKPPTIPERSDLIERIESLNNPLINSFSISFSINSDETIITVSLSEFNEENCIEVARSINELGDITLVLTEPDWNGKSITIDDLNDFETILHNFFKKDGCSIKGC